MPITVRNAADVRPEVRPSIHGGDGSFEMRFVYGDQELVSALRVFELCRLPPGTSIGEHLHDETEEIYFILSGVGTMDLDGTPRRCTPATSSSPSRCPGTASATPARPTSNCSSSRWHCRPGQYSNQPPSTTSVWPVT